MLSDEQKAQLHQDALPLYLASTGDPQYSGLLGMLRVGADANRYQDQRIEQLQSGDREYIDGIPPSDNNYPAIEHQKLKQDVDVIQAEGIASYKDGYDDLKQLFFDLSSELNEAVGKSKQGWEGGAADNAHGYFTSLSTWADANSENAELASRIISEETDAAIRARDSMPEPIPFNLEQEMDSWGYNPFTFHEQVDQTITKMAESRAAHDEAARVMTQYDSDLYQAGNKQPAFAEPPKFNGAGGSGDTSASGVIQINDPGTSASGFAGGVAGSAGGGVPTGGGSVSVPSGGAPSGGGSFTPVAPGPSTGAAIRPGSTRPSGLQPNGWRPSIPGGRNNNGGRNTFGPGGGPGIGPMPMGPAGGFGPGGGGGGYGGGRLSAGGFGPGGGGAAGPGAGPGAGAATGAKPMGGPVAAGPGAAAPGAAGAARGAGMAGAPMGAGGGKGQGSEDSEHQRPTYLVEADPDEVFGTSQRTAPPVIGA
ncbi:hypothetical protein [Saccharomonospora cyanea]|uniref:PPE family protein n=1 Tax=Saccharomonospora cyanea NA-134 TaxID=882082 RepID=H5XCB9_9PSEU|nr:hypothetical protein [Saccharomonospora cyanea]EHR59125.1 hypothetical protein SaccyDRAFT_0185 [Saccharomonospora cyanea NA-134]